MIKLFKTVGAALLISSSKSTDPQNENKSHGRLLDNSRYIDNVSCSPLTQGEFAQPLSDCLQTEAKFFLTNHPDIVDNSFSNKIFVLNGETIKCKIPSWNNVEFINHLVNTCSTIGNPLTATRTKTSTSLKPTTGSTLTTKTTAIRPTTTNTKPSVLTDPTTLVNPDGLGPSAGGLAFNTTNNAPLSVYTIAGISTGSVFFLGVAAAAVACVVKKKNQPKLKPKSSAVVVGKPHYLSPRV